MHKRLLIFSTAVCLGVLGTPSAKADLLFTGSQANVLLHSVSATDVMVTVTLSGGSTAFVNTGNGTNHPGFAFNLAGPSITSANILNSTNLGAFHVDPVVTSGPAFGTFGYFFDNPGNGASANNSGPLTFDIVRASGVSLTDLIANRSGYYFATDILNNGNTVEVGINSPPTPVVAAAVPEPTTILLLGTICLGLIASRRVRLES